MISVAILSLSFVVVGDKANSFGMMQRSSKLILKKLKNQKTIKSVRKISCRPTS